MNREFLVEEIMLDGVSGEIRGRIEFDSQSGLIAQVECETFCFRQDDADSPTLLDPPQRAQAIELVERLLEGESDVAGGSGRFVASARSFAPRPAVTPSTRILAEYLQSPGREHADEEKRRAQ